MELPFETISAANGSANAANCRTPHSPAPPPRVFYRAASWLRALLVRATRLLVPAPVALYEQLTGVWQTEMIYAAAQLELADRLAEGPRSAAELADDTRADADALERLLRALSAVGIFARGRDGRYRLNRLAEPLRRDAPASLRDMVLYGGSPHSMAAWRRFVDVVRTGRDGYTLALGKPLFDYLAEHPDEGERFGGAMVCMTRLEAPALAAGYDFAAFARLCDVGGGRGALLGAILARHRRLSGVLFDDARVVAGAGETLDGWGVRARCELVGGSFFVEVPAGCDGYVLKEILHDWDDARACAILATVRRAMRPGARLLIVEMLLVDDARPHPAKLLDLQMLTATHRGRQRTRAQFDALLAQTGFRLARVVGLATPSSIVEAIAV